MERELEYLVFDNIEFDFDSMFQNQQTKALFEHFLDEIFCTEQKSFQVRAHKLLKESDENVVMNIAHEIKEKHFRPVAK